jgi:histidine ammonia-lyase
MISIAERPLSLAECSEILFGNRQISLSGAALKKVGESHSFLQAFSKNKLIYGINTGFGPMAQYKISDENLVELQYNLIRSHCSGSGALLSPLLTKALMLARLNTLMQGYSGVHIETVELLASLINHNVYPCIYEHGGVGASGDLIQLAHLALVLIGEGEVLFEGKIEPTDKIFERLGIRPLSIHIREGLAILNGTSAMTGIGIVNIVQAKKLLAWSVTLSAMTNEVMEAYDDHFSYELNVVKKHTGQNRIAGVMREMLGDSSMIRNRSQHLYRSENIEQNVFEDKVQEYYSLRCVSQVLGPIYDTIHQAEKVVIDELNSVNDNPIIDQENNNIFHGGNFHGDYVSLEMDKLKMAVTKLSMLAERQLNFLLNDKLNNKFPPFINMGTLGLNFGMQGMQFTATSTVAENQTLSFPMYVHSIPNNNDNQDIVSMGCNSANLTKKVIENSFEVLAIEMATILQAIDYLDCTSRLSGFTHSIYDTVRQIIPTQLEDKARYKELRRLKVHLETVDPLLSGKIDVDTPAPAISLMEIFNSELSHSIQSKG